MVLPEVVGWEVVDWEVVVEADVEVDVVEVSMMKRNDEVPEGSG